MDSAKLVQTAADATAVIELCNDESDILNEVRRIANALRSTCKSYQLVRIKLGKITPGIQHRLRRCRCRGSINQHSFNDEKQPFERELGQYNPPFENLMILRYAALSDSFLTALGRS
jgi:hypothetical protein